MIGAGLRAHSGVALGLAGDQQVAFECQQALAAGAVDVLTHRSWKSTGGGISLWYLHTASQLKLCSQPWVPRQRQRADKSQNYKQAPPR